MERLDLDQGRLVMASDMAGSMEHWEIHPDGEEALVRMSGTFDVIIEGDLSDSVRLDEAHSATVIPEAFGTGSTPSRKAV